MPASKPCSTPGCPNLSPTSGPCRACGRADTSKPGKKTHRYSKAWTQRARAQVQREPRCIDCGTTQDLTADHITPKINGGTDHPSNLCTRCRRCNGRKSANFV